MRKTWLGAAVLLLTAACGGGSDEATDEEKETAAASISAYWESTGLSTAESDCLGEAAVEQFGIGHLQDLEILDDELVANAKIATAFTSSTDSRTAATIIVDCLTMTGIMKRQYQGADDKTAQCLADAYGRDRMIDAMAAELTGEGSLETPEDVTAEMRQCAPKG